MSVRAGGGAGLEGEGIGRGLRRDRSRCREAVWMAAKRIGLVMNVWRMHWGDSRDGIRDGMRGRSMVFKGNLCFEFVVGRENHSPKVGRRKVGRTKIWILNPIFPLIPELV